MPRAAEDQAGVATTRMDQQYSEGLWELWYEDDGAMCTETRTSKEDDETDDNFQQSGKGDEKAGWLKKYQKLALALDMIGQKVTI